ncbi:hypothetical protein C9374_007734 [Naegleria lovaniensis]|uniref:Electron transfer flavoprotein subunit beta n=1 Tax=Naegleria lovaniensis TaxID=51637 RepID=A0AA88GL18_NAELO|nr:uncharacterized protein C9374_007734 [Naegleria lovaniensis]KAG2379096.1 hypothetical protein C9374_007734 [Naegleria lovaniensis]
MKILVGLKRVIDYSVSVRVNKQLTGVVTQQVKHSMNPFDDIALEEGIRIKEKFSSPQLISVSIGNDQCQEVLRQALAKGCDEAIHVKTDFDSGEVQQWVSPLQVAHILRRIVEENKIDLVLLGKQSIDSDNGHVAQLLASMLGAPQATFISKLIPSDAEAKQIEIEREVDGGLERLMLSGLPAVVSCDLRLNEPRFANLKAIIQAKKKPLTTLNFADLVKGTDFEQSQLEYVKVTEPKAKSGSCVFVENAQQLVDKLRNEAKVL